MPNRDRGIAFHNVPKITDVCAAHHNLANGADLQVVLTDDIIDEMVRMYSKETGIKQKVALKAIRDQWKRRTKHEIFLRGALLFAQKSGLVAVPIAVAESPLFDNTLMEPDEREQAICDALCLANRPAIGHAFFTKDSAYPLMAKWLKLRANRQLGGNRGLVGQISNASSDESVKALEVVNHSYEEVTMKALPKPKDGDE